MLSAPHHPGGPVSCLPLSPEGRWGGAVTQRPLPAADEEIAAMPDEQRTVLARLWWSQAATERRVAQSFAVVERALTSLEADAGIVATAGRAVDDEHRHAALCQTMASRYLGAEAAPAPELPFAHPRHPAARSEEVRAALYVVGQCVFNETFASAYLAACLDAATHPLARAALRELLSDEIDHARVGWAFLATMPGALRADITDWLLPLGIANLREWRALTLPAPGADLERHGVPARARIEEALVSALRGVIAPGVAHVGLRSAPFAQWAEGGART